MTQIKYNDAYQKRLAQTAKILGKDQEIEKIDEETGEKVIVKKQYKGKPITREQAQDLEYRAIVSEGHALYHAKEYRRAIDAFTQALEKQKDDQSILIDRANCYIKVGQPEDALRDVDQFLSSNQNDPRGILSKAEAYFSMGEFEFALVFSNAVFLSVKDMSAFKDGITKCKSAILDSINGENLFQANPNFAVSRPRKALITMSKERQTEQPVDEAKLQATQALLPEKVEPLQAPAEKAQYLGELQLDYDYLLELQEEVKQLLNEEDENKAEDEKIASVVEDALLYLDQRGAFWSQQGGGEATGGNADAQSQTSKSNRTSASRTRSAAQSKTRSPQRGRTAHYEMSKIQQYEAKYGSPDGNRKSGRKAVADQTSEEQ